MNKKRIFIVSDLHGIKKVYDSIINDLEILASTSKEEIVLYINGDVIDRGPDSIYILQDVMKRVKGQKGNITVKMLAGNHEMNMLEALEKKVGDKWPSSCNWFYKNNGGQVTARQFDNLPKEEQDEIVDFIYNLPLYETIEGEIFNNKGVIITHARPPRDIKTTNIKVLKDALKSNHNYNEVFKILWTRETDLKSNDKIGIKDYFTIIGHTPIIHNGLGFEYNKFDNTLNIDGGCAYYARNNSFNLREPLVELNFKKNHISIDTYDQNGKKRDNYIMDSHSIYRINNTNNNIINNNKNIQKQNEINNKIDDSTIDIKEGTIHIKKRISDKEKFVLQSKIAILGVITFFTTKELISIGKNMITKQKEPKKLVLSIEDENNKKEETTIELTYTVKENDNLTIIADKYNVTIEDIAKYNNIDNINLIYPNQKLIIPYTLKNDELTRFINFLPEEKQTSKLAQKYHTTEETLNKLNKIIKSNKKGVIVPNKDYIIENYNTESIINTTSRIRVLTKKGFI